MFWRGMTQLHCDQFKQILKLPSLYESLDSRMQRAQQSEDDEVHIGSVSSSLSQLDQVSGGKCCSCCVNNFIIKTYYL
jgi:hypothetical protein